MHTKICSYQKLINFLLKRTKRFERRCHSRTSLIWYNEHVISNDLILTLIQCLAHLIMLIQFDNSKPKSN